MELRTDRYKLKEVFPEKAKSYAQKLKRKAGELEFVRKGILIDPKDIEIKEGERAAIRLVTTPHLDRDNEILIPSGGEYSLPMSVLWAHDYKSLPIGSDRWIKTTREGILAKTYYANHQFAEDVYQCVKDKHLNSNSVGFIPVEAVTPEEKKQFGQVQEILEKDYGIPKDESGKAKNIYTKWIMLEHSDVPVASNTQSLNLAVSKGELVIQSERLRKDLEIGIVKDKKKDKEIELAKDEEPYKFTEEEKAEIDFKVKAGKEVIKKLKEEKEIQTKPETTEQYHRIPVEDPDKHKGHRIRTITISAEQGIMALYCGEDKVVITYLFDVEKWSMEEAQAWVREHKDFKPSEEETNMEEEAIGKGVIPYKDLGKADEGESWDGPGEVAKADVDDLKLMCAWFDSENPDVKSSYKLPHHKAEGHSAVWKAVAAAMGALLGARGGVQIPDGDRKGVYNHLKAHYSQFDKEAPEFKEFEDGKSVHWTDKAVEVRILDIPEFQDLIKGFEYQLTELKEGRVLSTKNRELIRHCIDQMEEAIEALEELHSATEPPAREEGKRPEEREIIIERDGKRDDLDGRIAHAVGRLFEGDRLGKMMDDAIKEALDIGIKKKLGKVE